MRKLKVAREFQDPHGMKEKIQKALGPDVVVEFHPGSHKEEDFQKGTFGGWANWAAINFPLAVNSKWNSPENRKIQNNIIKKMKALGMDHSGTGDIRSGPKPGVNYGHYQFREAGEQERTNELYWGPGGHPK